MGDRAASRQYQHHKPRVRPNWLVLPTLSTTCTARGRDIMEGGDAVAHQRGTPSMAPRPPGHHHDCPFLQDLVAALGLAAGLPAASHMARVLGVHLKAPINDHKLGATGVARPACTHELSWKSMHWRPSASYHHPGPEVPGNMGHIGPLCDAGYRIQIGPHLGQRWAT